MFVANSFTAQKNLFTYNEVSEQPFSQLELELSHFARAIGHPARIAVLLAIAAKGGEVNGEIVKVDNVAQGTVIQHLRDLKRSGLIGGKIFGVKSHYWIESAQVKTFIANAEQLAGSLIAQDDKTKE